ncbi:MAG: NAD-dependent epimerase/dehydratase family protein [Chloroflexi bacterium]|nr:NAD-dependent epimerase/dehydratase family protein [Chloroflexota bacterium]
MKTLVIGGSRFVGLHLVRELLKDGRQVAVLNRGVTPADLPPQVERLRADRRDPAQMRSALAGRRFDAVFDIVCEQVADAEILAEALPGMGHYVMCSGTRIYAMGDIFPVTESSPLDPDPPADSVGAIRLACADLLTEAGRRHGYPVTVIRPHRIYGPDNYNLAWEPSFFARVEQGRPIIVPGDGLTMHQWVHVDDLARSFMACVGNASSHGEVYIVAGDEIPTLNGYIRIIGEIVGKAPDVRYLDPKKVPALESPVFPYNWDFSRIFSIQKIADHLGWRPRIGLREGLEDCYRWYKERRLDQAPWDFAYEQEVARSIPTARRVIDSTPPQGPEVGLTPAGDPSPAGGPGAGNP